MTNKELLHGIIVPIVTPMDEEEQICEKELRKLINRLIDAGVHGIFCGGTNGEGYILSTEEKEELIRITADEVKGRVPVYAGTGCVSTRETVQLSVRAKALGADVLSIITPWFAAASQEELYAHYRAVAEAVELPIVLYNIPMRTGNALTPETVRRLSEIDNIAGVKDSSGNFQTILSYLTVTEGRDFAVLSGNDALILWTLLAGGCGGVSGCANAYPETVTGIYEAFIQGDIGTARKRQEAIRPFRESFRFGNSHTMIKEAVNLQGYSVGSCRKPFDRISEEGMAALRKVMEENERLGIR